MDRDEERAIVLDGRDNAHLSWADAGAAAGVSAGKARTLYKEANKGSGEPVSTAKLPGPTRRARSKKKAKVNPFTNPDDHPWLYASDRDHYEIYEVIKRSTEVEWVFPSGIIENCKITEVLDMYYTVKDDEWIVQFRNASGYLKYCSIHRIIWIK
jgi:hypothetical protein